MIESLTSIRRAGASLILTYFARDAANAKSCPESATFLDGYMTRARVDGTRIARLSNPSACAAVHVNSDRRGRQ
jgi:hypothetical protein